MLIRGRLLRDPCETPAPGWLAVDAGRIAEMGEGSPPGRPDFGDEACVITPGFIDAHLHLSQFEAMGCDGLDLLDWLERVIYPAEARWQDKAHAAGQIDAAHSRLLDAGTLGYAGYLTSHPHGPLLLGESLRRSRLRAVAGQVLMDRSAPASLTNQPIEPPRPVEDARYTPSVNPRFGVGCSADLLRKAGKLAGEHCFVQSHLAESKRECEVVQELFPDASHYTGVYDRAGLLTPRTLLAHAVHLSDEEWSRIAERGSVVVHCPAANTFLQSGLFDIKAARDHGVRLALGSDVAAGPDVAMPRAARAMIEVAKMRRMTLDPGAIVPGPAEVWNLITRGNAEALGWADAGRLDVGAAADLLVLRVPFEIDEHLIGRLIYTWRDAYIAARVVDGQMC